jgi:putative ABC transport system substrate-binding protein
MEEAMNKIGFLISATDTGTAGTGAGVWDQYIKAFKNAIGTAHYHEEPARTRGHGAGGDKGQYDTAAKNLAADNDVRVIVTAGTQAAIECQTYAPNIPLVVASAGDLSVLTGNNFTGCTNGQLNLQILDARIVLMLQQFRPQNAVVVAGNDSVGPVQKAMQNAMTSVPIWQKILQQNVVPVYLASFTDASDFKDPATIQRKLKGTPTADVLLVCSDPLVRTNGTALVQAAHALGMNTMHEFAEWVQQHGGNLSYGPNFTTLFQKAAGFVDQILNHNTPAANIPVFNPQLSDCVQTP